MSLRRKLLLVALCTLVLPLAGWLYLRQMDEVLRHGQEQALTAVAQALARSLLRTQSLPQGTAGWYVQRAEHAIDVDGYGGDWAPMTPWAQAFPGHGQLLLAQAGGATYLYASVVVPGMAHSGSRRHPSAYLDLDLAGAFGVCRYRLASVAPGAISAAPRRGSAKLCPPRLRAQWREDGSGYRVELRVPRGPDFDQLGIAASTAVARAPATRPLWRYRPALSATLAQLAPPGTRARLFNADAWLLAAGGDLTVPTATPPSRWSVLAYRALIAHGLNGSADLAWSAPRSDATEVWQALSGVPAVSWRSGGAGAVVLAAAVPLQSRGDPRGVLVLEQPSRSMPLLANRGLLWLLLGSLMVLLLAGGILFAFATRLGARIARLRNAAERAAARDGRSYGEQPFPLLESRDELGDLARSFAHLLSAVGGYTDYLRSLASKLSHELNTPLAVVRSSLENLEATGVPAESRAYLQRAHDGADRLAALLRAMGSASRIERAVASAEAEDFDVGQLLVACVDGYRPLLGARRLELDLPPTPVSLHGAPELLTQALDKLFDNALSFTPAAGWIRVRLRLAHGPAGGVLIEVANQGPTLPAALAGHVFESLVSAREQRGDGETPHLGLGLYVVRLVAERFAGEARARNLDDASGVVFSLHLHAMPRQRAGRGLPG